MFLAQFLKNKKFQSKKNNNFEVFDDDKNTLFEKTNTVYWKLANYFIIFLILFSIFLIVFESIWDYYIIYKTEIFIADFFISSIFLIEYFYRFYHSDEKKIFSFRIMNLLDLLSFLPFFILLIFFSAWSYTFFTIFRVFRIFRIFELFQKMPIIERVARGIYTHKIEYLSAIFAIFIILVFFSILIYLVEKSFWPNTFKTIPEAIWWGVVTMTTVWYWDLVPVSTLWRIIWWILMFLWPILIAIISSVTVLIFMESTSLLWEKVKKCKKCKNLCEKKDKFCSACGEKL